MEILRYAAPILVGALIGYCTNYIAIKMLFRPKRTVKIGDFALPFTPGVIPKNQSRIARAVGRAVGSQLFTGEDLKEILLSETVREKAADSLVKLAANDGEPCRTLLKDRMGETRYEQGRDRICGLVTGKVQQAAESINIVEIIQREGGALIRQKLEGTMLAMFLNESLIAAISGEVGKGMEAYIREHGEELIRPQVEQEIAGLEERTPKQLWNTVGIEEKALRTLLEGAYEEVVSRQLEGALQQIDIAKTVEAKINGMDVDEIEQLVMDVMKQELQTVINLGALIGAVLGAVNIFF